MKGRITIFWLLAAIFLLITVKCAKQASPTGGPRDIDPPKIVKSIPRNGITGFKGNNIVVTFDEYVAFDKLNEKFMVSPPMEEKPKIFLRGKNLNIEFQEKLKDSTTYTLYFQDAIKDLNEGNPYNNFQFVLSTGPVIDSLSLTGNILLADNLEPDKNILILLHRNLADSMPRKRLPDYITLADVNGGFRIDNIKEGTYRIFGLKDNNNNKKYDLADEEFAFSDSIIHINPRDNYLPVKKDTSTVRPKPVNTLKTNDSGPQRLTEKKPAGPPLIDGQQKLFLFTPAKKAYYLPSNPSRKLPFQLTYILSLPPDTLNFEVEIPGIKTDDYIIERSIKGDTINIWLSDSSFYSSPEIKTILKYPFTDSTKKNVYRRDSITMRYIAPRTPKTKVLRNTYKYSVNISGNSISPGKQIIFSSPTPFRKPDTSRIRFYEIESKVRKAIPYSIVRDSLSTRRLFFRASTKEGGKYQLIADSAAFGNIFGEVADSVGFQFSVRETNSYGHLELDIQNGSGNLIIQLLDNREKVIAERRIKNSGLVDFPMIERGIYKARVIYDLNGDGKWTTGDFDRHLQPEPVSYYPSDIEIKIDWIINQPWDISKRNFKTPVSQEKKQQEF